MTGLRDLGFIVVGLFAGGPPWWRLSRRSALRDVRGLCERRGLLRVLR